MSAERDLAAALAAKYPEGRALCSKLTGSVSEPSMAITYAEDMYRAPSSSAIAQLKAWYAEVLSHPSVIAELAAEQATSDAAYATRQTPEGHARSAKILADSKTTDDSDDKSSGWGNAYGD